MLLLLHNDNMSIPGGPAVIGNGGHGETGLDPIAQGWKINRGPTDYMHAVLPYIFEQETTNETVGRIRNADFAWRMTSPYEPFTGSGYTDVNAGAKVDWEITPGGTNTPDINTVAYWGLHSALYNYYSVISCRWRCRIENLGHEKFFVHQMHTNNVIPPTNASNWDMKLWKGVKSQLVHPIARFGNSREVSTREATAYNEDSDDMHLNDAAEVSNGDGSTFVVENPVGSSFAYFEGEYRPGDYERQVHLDDAVSIYTPINQNPTLGELLLLRIKPYDNATSTSLTEPQNFSRPISFNITFECEYLVEFKELDSRLRWPTSRNPLSIVYNTDASE